MRSISDSGELAARALLQPRENCRARAAAIGSSRRRREAGAGDGVGAAFVAEQISPAAAAGGFAGRIAAPGERAGAADQGDAAVVRRGGGENRLGVAGDANRRGDALLRGPSGDSLLLDFASCAGEAEAGGSGGRLRQVWRRQMQRLMAAAMLA